MEKRKILFVDDEPNILAGLRRMLRSMRGECELQFAESGQAALDLMEGETFDVVVSDMRMPGMDGAQLLSIIQERSPRTIRLMLTGQADDASIIRTIGVVHQFLAKPCEPEKLKSVLKKSLALQGVLNSDHLKRLVSQIGALPSIPDVYLKLQKAIRDPEVSIDDIARVIEQDIAMSVKVLQIVNSAFFGLYNRIESPARAVKLLGLETVKALVLGVQIFDQLKVAGKVFSAKQLWSHSMSVATMAKAIAVHTSDNQDLVNDCFLGGLLHDIGKLVLVSLQPEKYLQAEEMTETKGLTLLEAERTIFNATHAEVGAYLIGLWGFTNDLLGAVAFHHDPHDYPAGELMPTHAVHVANAIYYRHNPEEAFGQYSDLDMGALCQIATLEEVEEWIEICENHLAGLG